MKRFFLFGFLFAATFSFGQAVSSVPVGKNNNGVPTETLVTICATNPGNGTCNSLVTTYTDITLGTSCGGTLGNLNGPGCSNPGYTDVLGNALAYAAAGSYYCQFSGSSTSPHSVPCPAAGAGGGGSGGTLVISAAFGTGSVTAPSPVGTNTCPGNPFAWIEDAGGTYQSELSIDPSLNVGGFSSHGFLNFCRPPMFNSSGATPGFTFNGNAFNVYSVLSPTSVMGTQWEVGNPSGDSATYSAGNLNGIYFEMSLHGTPTITSSFVANERIKFIDSKTGGSKPFGWSAIQGAVLVAGKYDKTNCATNQESCYVGVSSVVQADFTGAEDETGVVYSAFEATDFDNNTTATNATAIDYHATFSTSPFANRQGFVSEDFGSGANSYDLYLKGTSTTGKNYFGGPTTFAQAISGLSLTLTDTAANTDLSTSNTTPTVTGASTTVALSTGTPPSNLSGNSWVYTLAATESGAGTNGWAGATVTLSGWTGGATGNNCASPGCPITASTTTTVTVTNATGTTTNTGTPVMISTAVSSSPLVKIAGTVNTGTAGTLNSAADFYTWQDVPQSVAPNPVTFLTLAHTGSSSGGGLELPNGAQASPFLRSTSTPTGFYYGSGSPAWIFGVSGTDFFGIKTNGSQIGLNSGGLLTFANSSTVLNSGNMNSDTTVGRKSAGVVEFGTGTSANDSGTIDATAYQAAGTAGVTAGPFTALSSIQSSGGILTGLSGTSDPRLKIMKPYTGGLDVIAALHPIRYHWNEKGHIQTGLPTDQEFVGFNAANAKQALPQTITGTEKAKDGSGAEYLSFDDRPIVAALVNAVQQQQKEIKQLREEIRILKKSSVPSKE